MQLPGNNNTDSLPSKPGRAAGIYKRLEKFILALLQWALAVTFPVWIYGLCLALGKMEANPILAMLLLVGASGFFLWRKIIKPAFKNSHNQGGAEKSEIL